ncbi:glycosyltransferase 29 protein [Cymbomonas tetramitiformis]|uniref:Glycosyltransferase 29 protein n=1 Tax=Cymbomonas tetramitiformis TaxID=36881 RepID=A0AAE0GXD6_9CHLO|nr:glycosyltransferase 29 protein [Cymbomonas tetramitiformis]
MKAARTLTRKAQKPSLTGFAVLVLTCATLWILMQLQARRVYSYEGAPMYSRVFDPRDAQYSNDFPEEIDTDEGEEVEVPRVTQQPPRVKKVSKKQQSNNSSNIFKQQLQSLLATPVPIVLNKAALQSKNAFSCGGTHVVKLNSYKDLKSLRHVEEALPEYDMFYPSRNDKIFDKCAVVGNSGSLLEAERGLEIDAHDVVIRFNAGITEGYGRGLLSRL